MIQEFIPAIMWLEQDYNARDEQVGYDGDLIGWRLKPSRLPDGRHGFYQQFDLPTCGEYMADLCEESREKPCTHPEHRERVKCWCLPVPGCTQGLPWTLEDERFWLETGNPYGETARYNAYLKTEYPSLYHSDYEPIPNDIDFWKEDEEANAT
jgi:hypothetical protein